MGHNDNHAGQDYVPSPNFFWDETVRILRGLLDTTTTDELTRHAALWFDLHTLVAEQGCRTEFLSSPAVKNFFGKHPALGSSAKRTLLGRRSSIPATGPILPRTQNEMTETAESGAGMGRHFVIVDAPFETFLYDICAYYEFTSMMVEGTPADTWAPKISLVTSLFKGNKFLEYFMSDLLLTDNWKSVELIIIDVNKGLDDFQQLLPFIAAHSNVRYVKLKSDPGLYDVWNLGIKLARAEYVGNTNIDDRRAPSQLATILKEFSNDVRTTVVSTWVVPFSDLDKTHDELLVRAPHIYFQHYKGDYGMGDLFAVYDGKTQSQCIPHCMPVWRKSVHDRFGYFDEKEFSSSADWAYWLRMKKQNLQFSVASEPLTYYYINPNSYMRTDMSYQNVTDKIVAVYHDQTLPEPAPYFPDFAALFDSIDFTIN